MKHYFSGIGGIGISALAQFCALRGDEVKGSDLGKTEITDILQTKGIPVLFTQTTYNITSDIDLLVYSEAVPDTNPERIQSAKIGIPEKSYFEYLGEISRDYKTVAIAGTHGKTTTTALFGAGVKNTSFRPHIFVGSTLAEFGGSNFSPGVDNWLVCEACEYRNNFRFLDPEIVVITSLEWDHVDSFPTEESYYQAFTDLVSKAQTIIFHADEPNIDRILGKFTGEKIPVPRQSDNSLEFLLQIFGDFNERNALLALALAHKLGLNMDTFKQGIGSFVGSGRRQEYLGEKNGVKIYDDYAHHPTEVAVLLRAFKEKFPDQKIAIVFEPHQFSRTKQFFGEFVESLQLADKAAFFPIYAARDTDEDKQFDLQTEINGSEFGWVESFEDVERFTKELNKGDILLFCGAGKISAFAREYLDL